MRSAAAGWSIGTMWPASRTRRKLSGPLVRSSPAFLAPAGQSTTGAARNAPWPDHAALRSCDVAWAVHSDSQDALAEMCHEAAGKGADDTIFCQQNANSKQTNAEDLRIYR